MGKASCSEEENPPLYFGEWLRRRREELNLTQAQLGQRACCTVFTIRKIEAGERRPSRQLAGLLAQALDISGEDQETFIDVARGELNLGRLPSPARITTGGSQPAIGTGPVPGYLPRTLTPFIGREPELSALGPMLQDPQCSLLTIAGLGGSGKTRLAIEAACRYQELFPDGVWFVPLAALNSATLLVPAIADAVNFRFLDPAKPKAQLLRYLRDKRALLVLDNAEHLLDEVGVFAEIITDCPQIKLLVTSRERLNLLSEWVFEIGGLPVPAGDRVEQFELVSSVALFLQSARRVRAGFELREEERRWVYQICQMMDGMPLGIELSAAWVGLLPCEVIAREIEHNIDFLAVSMGDLPERQRSLRATMDYSWAQLDAEEKRILARLSVFRGSFRLDAAREICEASLAILASLRNKLLLYRTDQGFYHLHELVRQYAGLRLGEDPGEAERVRDRHASYYVCCLAEWEQAINSSRKLETFEEMAQVIDNLSQGWQRMVTLCRPGTGNNLPFCAERLHSSLFSLSHFYEMRCRSWEAVTLFTQSVKHLKAVQGQFEKTEDHRSFISVLSQVTAYLGMHHAYVLQYDKAREYLKEAIELAEKYQSCFERALAQSMLAWIDFRQGHYQNSVAYLKQCRDVFKEAGRYWYFMYLINLARAYLPLGRVQEAEALCDEGFRLLETGDASLELMLRIEYAYGRYLQKDFIQAEQLMRDNLKLSEGFRNHRITANICIDFSKVMLDTGRVELAEKYLQESVTLLSEFGESDDLAYSLIHLGKCFLARSDIEAARQRFRQAIKIALALDMFYLVYWGLVNMSRIYRVEGQTQKALEMLCVLRDCPVEYQEAKDEGDRLLADLQAGLQDLQVKAAMEQLEGEGSANQARAEAMARALVWESG